MSDELFEVAFSGQIIPGRDFDEVKARVAKIFSADEAKLAQLFSGKRVVIKKNVDEATAAKYKTALNHAGAECEVKSLNADEVPFSTAVVAESAAPASAPSEPVAGAGSTVGEAVYEAVGGGAVAPPPKVDPLGIKADEIDDLAATIAPIGSELQSQIKHADAPEIDISEFDIAPVGSELSTAAKKEDPPPPDTSGISMADER